MNCTLLTQLLQAFVKLLDLEWVTNAYCAKKVWREVRNAGELQQLTQALSQLLSVPWVSLYHIEFSRQLLDRVPRELAERFGLVPIFVRNVRGQGETLYVATDDPTNEAALAEVSRVAGLPTRPMIASTSDIQAIVQVHYAPSTQRTVIEPQAVTRPEGLKKASSTPAAPPEPKVRPEKKKAQTTNIVSNAQPTIGSVSRLRIIQRTIPR